MQNAPLNGIKETRSAADDTHVYFYSRKRNVFFKIHHFNILRCFLFFPLVLLTLLLAFLNACLRPRHKIPPSGKKTLGYCKLS